MEDSSRTAAKVHVFECLSHLLDWAAFGAGMDRVGLAKSSLLGWAVLAAFFAAVFAGGAALLAAPSWASKAGGGLLTLLGIAVGAVLWSGGQFDQNNSSAAASST